MPTDAAAPPPALSPEETMLAIPIPPLAIGSVVRAEKSITGLGFGDLRIESVIGHGGTATVYQATSYGHPHPLALKVPRTLCDILDITVEGRWTPPATREIPYAADWYGLHLFTLPSIEDLPVQVGISRFYPLTLRQHLDKQVHDTGGGFPEETAVRWLIQAASCLEASGLVHRDLKPDNIFLDSSMSLRIGDWGLAIPATPEERQRCGLTGDDCNLRAGTIEFVSPEQMALKPSLDHRSDIYSLGLVFYEMLVGQPARPDRGTDVQLYRRTLVRSSFYVDTKKIASPRARSLCERMITTLPISRFQTYQDLIAACRS